MSYPFYCLAATHSTASQHPCRLSLAAAVVAAPFLLLSHYAYAALSCTEQPTCTELGYSKTEVAGCESYVLCPFDTSYMACTKYGEAKCTNGYAKILSDCNPFKTSIVQPGTGGSIVVQPGGNLGTVTGTTNRASLAASATAGTAGAISGGNLGSVDLPSMSTIFHEEGWYLNENDKDSAGCYKCEQKTCPSGTSTSKTCSDANQTAQATGDYAGNNACYKCVTTKCSTGYKKTVAECGSSGSKGWTLNAEDQDEAGCFKCEKKSCPTGTSVGCSIYSYKSGTTNYYQGNTQCIKCTTCPDNGYSTSTKCNSTNQKAVISPKDSHCYTCETCYNRQYYGCTSMYMEPVDKDGNVVSDGCFVFCRNLSNGAKVTPCLFGSNNRYCYNCPGSYCTSENMNEHLW